MTITVFGSVNVDVVAYAERLPSPGETVHGSGYAIGLAARAPIRPSRSHGWAGWWNWPGARASTLSAH